MHQNPQETLGVSREEFAAGTDKPVMGLEPHSAPMDMLFYNGTLFPGEYRHSVFLALHGSWNRADPVGYKVVVIPFGTGQPEKEQDFLTGFYLPESNAHFGRPCGLAVAPDGALFVSDDNGGAIYRISYPIAPPASPPLR
jgi:glucose/arabinose dehydrogenase